MNIRLILRLIGLVLMFEGLLMLPAAGVCLYYGEGEWLVLLLCGLGTALFGFLLHRIRPSQRNMHVRDGYAAVAFIWVLISLFGALPFTLSGAIPSYLDAVFETVSGFTTTGSTLLTDIEAMPRGLHFWRAFTHWLGGMGVLVMTIALAPSLGKSSMILMRAESPGPSPGKLLPRMRETAKAMYLIYLGLSVLLFIILLLCGMPIFDSFIHTFATAGTGGFSNRALSVGAYGNPAVEWVLTAFMLLFGVNFTLYFLLLSRSFKRALRNEELWLYLGLALGGTLLISYNIRGLYGGFIPALRHAAFHVSSMMTTTGYATANFDAWPEFSRTLLMLLMLIGGCAGSTAGGIKVVRALLLTKAMGKEFSGILHPRMVRTVKMDGKPVEDDVFRGVLIYLAITIALILAGVLVISLNDFDFTTSLTAVLTCLGNTGPGLGLVGPMGNFAAFSPLSKLTLTLLMLTGRLEFYPVLLLLTPGFWKRA